MLKRHTILYMAVFGLTAASLSSAQQPSTRRRTRQSIEGVSIHRDLEFARAGTKSLLLDLYLPDDEANPPLVVWIHGGAWRKGSKGGGGRVRWLAEHG